ncbi:MAG: DUF3795 domain-containing protein [Candidatus Cloacimonetes bacterium]|nr:DUF3795 domain-containing protein [Candidatus Cloacimonadota bacterium]MBL7149484.1 DUF3795 domain-containing protein [Candidatus Cloacimonadota bacterium]
MSDKKELISYCGLYCGECPNYTGKIADLARDLRKELRCVRFEKTADVLSELSFFSMFKDYKQCYDVLGGMVKLRCNHACKDGGGNPYCKIRTCCLKKEIEGCWLCAEFETCEKLDELKANHGVAHIKNLRKINRNGIDGFLEGQKHWYIKPKSE